MRSRWPRPCLDINARWRRRRRANSPAGGPLRFRRREHTNTVPHPRVCREYTPARDPDGRVPAAQLRLADGSASRASGTNFAFEQTPLYPLERPTWQHRSW
ncbi:hypothetical protein G6F46_015723 [Rhizopus delemar]|nr:hypothetical protein G6F46_015723 [Rhizopus delemar]